MTISTVTAFNSGSNLQTYTFSSTDIGVAAENRVVFAAVSARKSGTGASTLLSVTINGVAAEIIRQTGAAEAGGYNVAAIVAAVVPTGTSVDVVVQWSTTHARSAGYVATSYDALPDAFDSDEVTGTGTLSPSVLREDGGTSLALAMVFSSDEALTVTSDATSYGSSAAESNPRVYLYDSTNESFTATTNGSTYTPVVIEASFRPQRLPAIRPHQKTRLHLRDSAQLDFGPEGATLTVNGTVSVADDVFTFPGSASDYIDAVQAATDTSTNVYSISGWFNADSIGAAFQTIAVHATGGGGPPMLVRLTTSSTLQFFHVSQSVSSIAVSSGNWYHFAAVWDGVNIELFLDGVSQGTTAYSTAETLGTAWEIGNWTLNNSHFAGKLADLRFNNYALTDGEVFDLYNEGRAFDLPERKQLPDTRLHLVDGLTDAGFYGQEVTNDGVAYANGVYSFDGTDDYITHGELLTSQAFSVSFWFKTASSANMYLWQAMNEDTAESEGTGIQLTGAKVRFFHGDGTSIEWLDKGLTYNDDAWHHVVCTWDGTTQTVYVDDDGSPATRTDSSVVWPAVADLVAGFGRDHRTGRLDKHFDGQLADGRVIEGTLTAGEVANLYRKGIPSIRQAEVLRIDPARYVRTWPVASYTFDGSTAVQTGISFDSSPYTFELDFNLSNLSSQQTLISQRNDTGGGGGWAFFVATDGSMTLVHVSVATLATASGLISAGTDYSLRVVVNPDNTAEIFLDDVSVATGSVGSLSSPPIDITLGARGDAQQYTTGTISNFRYGSGDLIDQTGNGNDLTLPDGYTVQNGVIVSDGSADGPDTGVNVASSSGTIAMWLKTTDTSFLIASPVSGQWVGAAEANGSAISSGVTDLVAYVDGAVLSSPTRNTLLTALNDGNWHHVAFTGDFASSWSNDVALMQFGGASTWRYTGEIDKVFISNTTKLTADQIAFLASSREFADPFPEPFLGLGGESLNIQPSRYSGNGDLLDESGNGNDQTLPSGYSVADGVISSDGTADGPTTGVSFTGLAASAGMWVKSTDTKFIGLYGGANTRFGMCWQSDGTGTSTASNVTNMTVYVDGVAISDDRQVFHDAAADGAWHHVAVTGDFVAGWNNNTIGTFQFDPEDWRYTGELDDIRFEAGRKWSAEEVKLLASSRGVELPNTRDAKLYFAPSYDDASNGGTTVIDYSGNQNTGTISGGPTWASNTSPDNGHRAIVSTGAGNVSFSDDDLPLGDSPRSVVTWVRPDDYSDNSQWFDYGSVGTGVQFGLGVRNSDWIVVVVGGGALGTQDTPAAGTWVPVVVTYAGGALDTNTEIWIDGVSKTLSTQAGTTNTTLNTTENVGRLLSSIAGQQVEAALDDVLVFDRVLTPAEIAFFSDKRNPYGTAAAETPVTGTAAVTYYRALVNSLATRGVF